MKRGRYAMTDELRTTAEQRASRLRLTETMEEIAGTLTENSLLSSFAFDRDLCHDVDTLLARVAELEGERERLQSEVGPHELEWRGFLAWMLDSPHNRNKETMDKILFALADERKAALAEQEASG